MGYGYLEFSIVCMCTYVSVANWFFGSSDLVTHGLGYEWDIHGDYLPRCLSGDVEYYYLLLHRLFATFLGLCGLISAASFSAGEILCFLCFYGIVSIDVSYMALGLRKMQTMWYL